MGRIVMGFGWALGLWLGACNWEAFHCSSDEACSDGALKGICQPDGWCSFPDASCSSSQRYAELSGDGVAGQCVPVGGPDAMDEPEADSEDDSGSDSGGESETESGGDSEGDSGGDPAHPDACVSDADGDGHDAIECGGDDCDDSAAGIVGPGDWAHCSACNDSCGALHACEQGTCVPARRVFTSSTRHTGDLGGLPGADAQCQDLADAAGLGGVFRAYLVGAQAGLGRLEHPAVPFVRLDGVRIADDWDDLTDLSIAAPMTRSEWRLPVGGKAWTGLVEVLGSLESNDCSDWTYELAGCLEPGQPCGGAGQTGAVDSGWDGRFVYHCSASSRLYCIEQDPDA